MGTSCRHSDARSTDVLVLHCSPAAGGVRTAGLQFSRVWCSSALRPESASSLLICEAAFEVLTAFFVVVGLVTDDESQDDEASSLSLDAAFDPSQIQLKFSISFP